MRAGLAAWSHVGTSRARSVGSPTGETVATSARPPFRNRIFRAHSRCTRIATFHHPKRSGLAAGPGLTRAGRGGGSRRWRRPPRSGCCGRARTPGGAGADAADPEQSRDDPFARPGVAARHSLGRERGAQGHGSLQVCGERHNRRAGPEEQGAEQSSHHQADSYADCGAAQEIDQEPPGPPSLPRCPLRLRRTPRRWALVTCSTMVGPARAPPPGQGAAAARQGAGVRSRRFRPFHSGVCGVLPACGCRSVVAPLSRRHAAQPSLGKRRVPLRFGPWAIRRHSSWTPTRSCGGTRPGGGASVWWLWPLPRWHEGLAAPAGLPESKPVGAPHTSTGIEG